MHYDLSAPAEGGSAAAPGSGAAADGRLPYLAGLDGLRALAVAAVLLYHADLPWAAGGFLGVDVFFVLSGYLITAILLAEWRATGGLDLRRFWARRIARLLPAMLVLLAAVLAFVRVLAPEEAARVAGDAAAALASGLNWRLIMLQESYFVAIGRPSPLQHLWSLAVEAHIYLLWPLALRWALRRAGRPGALLAALAGAALSAAAMALLAHAGADPSRLYYGSDTRAAAPLVGAALACLLATEAPGPRIGWRQALLGAFGLAAVGALGWCFASVSEFSPALYQGGFLAVALTAAVAVAAGVGETWAARGLGWRPLAALGRRSYSIYLWHWPVMVYTRPELDVSLSGLPLLAVRLAAVLLLAELSYRCVERPTRRWALGRARGGAGRAVAAGATLAGVALLSAYLSLQPALAPDDQAPEALHQVVRAGAAAAPAQPTMPATTEAPTAEPTRPAIVEGAAGPQPYDRPTQLAAAAPADPATPTPANPILAIGDSVMLGAVRELGNTFGVIEVDAQQSRQITAFIAIARERHQAGQLPATVIVHVGTNGPISEEKFDTLMEELRDVRRVVIVDVSVPRAWEQPNNRVLIAGVARYKNAVLADWKATLAGHPELLGRDGVHVNRRGARAYADLLAAAVAAH